MKHYYYILVFLLFSFFSCGTGNLPDTPTQLDFTLSSKIYGSSLFYTPPFYASTDTLIVTTSMEWKLTIPSSGAKWISVSQDSGIGNAMIVISYQHNPSKEERNSQLYFSAKTSGGYKTAVKPSIKQQTPSGDKSEIGRDCPSDMFLIYAGNKSQGLYTNERFKQYLVTNEKTPRPFIDGYLLLNITNEAGRDFIPTGKRPGATKEDWDLQLNYFIENVIPALDQGTSDCFKTLSQLAKRKKTKVVLFIPTPVRLQQNWGDNLDFRVEKDRITAVTWYIDEAVKRFIEAGFQNTKLVGFYWACESLGIPPASCKIIADRIHNIYNLDFFWIPYYYMEKYSEVDAKLADWKNYGFDCCSYQPNYYFYLDSEDTRVITACDRAHELGMGVEFEFDWKVWDESGESATYVPRMNKYFDDFETKKVWSDDSYITYYAGTNGLEHLAASSASSGEKELYNKFMDKITSRQIKRYK